MWNLCYLQDLVSIFWMFLVYFNMHVIEISLKVTYMTCYVHFSCLCSSIHLSHISVQSLLSSFTSQLSHFQNQSSIKSVTYQLSHLSALSLWFSHFSIQSLLNSVTYQFSLFSISRFSRVVRILQFRCFCIINPVRVLRDPLEPGDCLSVHSHTFICVIKHKFALSIVMQKHIIR